MARTETTFTTLMKGVMGWRSRLSLVRGKPARMQSVNEIASTIAVFCHLAFPYIVYSISIRLSCALRRNRNQNHVRLGPSVLCVHVALTP